MAYTLVERRLLNTIHESGQTDAKGIAKALGKDKLSAHEKTVLRVLEARGLVKIKKVPVSYRHEYSISDEVKQQLSKR